jgi:hypothetical protein
MMWKYEIVKDLVNNDRKKFIISFPNYCISTISHFSYYKVGIAPNYSTKLYNNQISGCLTEENSWAPPYSHPPAGS